MASAIDYPLTSHAPSLSALLSCIRKNHDYFFADSHLWLKKKGHERPNTANKILVGQMKFYNKHYIQQGSTAISRCIESTALRIDSHLSVPDDMRAMFRRESKTALVHEIAERKRLHDSSHLSVSSENTINDAHLRILREMLEDDGEDEDLARQFLEDSDNGFEAGDGKSEHRKSILDAYILEAKVSDSVNDHVNSGNQFSSKIKREGQSLP